MWKSSGDCEAEYRSSDDVRALRRQADRERKRAARQQATDMDQPDGTVLQGMEYG